MIDSDTVKLLIAAGVILLTGVVSVVAGARAPAGAAGTTPLRMPGQAPEDAPSTGEGEAAETRLRILTGEPGRPEARRPAARRALRLVLGIGVLAAGGAVGLLALVRALIALFRGLAH
jgi:hypothetical protein